MTARIDLALDGRDTPLQVYINGRLVTEVCVGVGVSRDDLEREVGSARAAKAALLMLAGTLSELERTKEKPDHNYKTREQRRAAFGAGLEDGLLGVEVPHPDCAASDKNPHGLKGVPPIPPEATPSYLRGYDLGMAIYRACAIAAPAHEKDEDDDPWLEGMEQ